MKGLTSPDGKELRNFPNAENSNKINNKTTTTKHKGKQETNILFMQMKYSRKNQPCLPLLSSVTPLHKLTPHTLS